jgi:hypothetical protein
MGHCKSWTLDSGMDSGMEYGLDCGLRFGLDFGLMRSSVTIISNNKFLVVVQAYLIVSMGV